MVGVVPVFYRIPVTAELAQCVQAKRYSTIVQRCIPSVPYRDAYLEEGLVPLAVLLCSVLGLQIFRCESGSVSATYSDLLILPSRAYYDPQFSLFVLS